MKATTPVRLEQAFDDASAISSLVVRNGPFSCIASYLPAAATGVRLDADAGDDVLPWFRSNWAVNGTATIPDAEIILHNPRFVDAARAFLDVDRIAPSTVVVNVNAPMRAGAVHVDIPSFRGATRDWCPLSLLQTMGASGLFEAWRVVEVGIVTWFYTGRGGAYDYWPDGLDAPMASVRPPFDNVALVADNDRMYHRIGWIGAPDAPSPVITSTATIHHDSAGWIIRDHGTTVATYDDDDVRVSILWKARAERLSEDPPPLSRDLIAQILQSDLTSRGRPGPGGADDEVLDDVAWLQHVHDTYYVNPHPAAVT